LGRHVLYFWSRGVSATWLTSYTDAWDALGFLPRYSTEPVDDRHKAIDREAVQVCVADVREVGRGDAGTAFTLELSGSCLASFNQTLRPNESCLDWTKKNRATQTERDENDNPKNPEEFLVSGQTYVCLNRGTALGYRHMSDLREQLNSLSPAEKAELLDAVWESLEADAVSLTDAQRAELDHRIARHEQNPSDVIPWPQVRGGLFKKP
jgi:putative addiction module component (TIGR02574 family)